MSTSKEIKEIAEGKTIYESELPGRETLNTIFAKYGADGITRVIKGAREKGSGTEEANEAEKPAHQVAQRQDGNAPKDIHPKLETINDSKLRYEGRLNDYYVLGGISQELNSLKVTLLVEEKGSLTPGRKERIKIDLYEREYLRQYITQLAVQFCENESGLEEDFMILTDLVEQYREQQIASEMPYPARNKKASALLMSIEVEEECIKFLSEGGLVKRIDEYIEKSGVVGEENSRKLLFIIASTYKTNTPLHALVQGTSGSGKSHLINSIGQCFPAEDVMSMTRVTSKSFYHYTKKELVDKLILLQDYDGLDEEAQYAFRELQSAGNISSSTVYKDRQGNIISTIKNVSSHFSSLLATTKAEVYYDNMSRSIIIGVDESEGQTERIVEYQNRKLAGAVNIKEEEKAKEFLQNCLRCIKPMEVVNPYADKIKLPIEAKMLRRLNSHYQAFVKQVTVLHQYQRKRDPEGRLVAEPLDLKTACDILFDAIIMKVDDLDSSLRQFYERMKKFVKERSKEQETSEAIPSANKENGKGISDAFTQRDIRLHLNIPKATCFRYMQDLEELEYIQRIGGYSNRGFRYRMVYWDDMEKVRTKIKAQLNEQLSKLPSPSETAQYEV